VLGKDPPEVEYRILLAGGDIRFIRGSGELQVDAMDRPLRMVGSAQDITGHKRAELAVRESEGLLRTIMDNASTVIFMKDLDGHYLHVNRQFETLFHVSNDGVRGKTDYELFPKDMADAFIRNDQKVVQSGQQLEVEELALHDDGCHIYLSVKFPIRNGHGELYAVCGMATDITERKRIELDLNIAAIAFECQEAMVITDANNIILRINKSFTESTGYAESDALGKKISILKSGRHDADFYAKMWESILSTGTWQGEIWDRRKNGEIYPKWLSITAVKGRDGIVTHYVGMHTDITERKAVEEQIKLLAFYDPLTGLPNRRLLYERLKHGINVERREGKQLALLIMDLDRFKSVNDSLGHLAGDELLQQVAGRIAASLRDVDMVARLGGDEFVVLLEDITKSDDAARIAEDIISDLSKPFNLVQGHDVQIGVSIGISLYPQHGDCPDALMDHADAALYQAKGAGRGRFAYFSKELTEAAQERMALETRLRHALEQQELRVFYQPQVDIISGRVIGAEALLRWLDPVEGLVMPSQFIPIAEETGLIVEIGAWVLREACRQGQEWLDEGLPPITLAVNVSAHQFRRSDFCALVASVLEETGFPAQYLELEITESGLLEKLVEDTATELLNRLRIHGIRLAIDDFGTGYSSLAYLKHFPLDVLKIDKSFIDDIPFQQDDMEIASTVVAMGHILGFKVLAEGVETQEQLSFLQEKGCDSYQGFLKSKPISADEFVKFLRGVE
jgi:diguanylate cyclase (GGDEF)-like protein/PAS domain S-box-containing protein